MEKFFKLKENGTNIRTEIIAGITTFMTMAYILFVNPGMLKETGMNQQGIFVATALSAAVASIIMGLLAKYPFALAPGMGLNAYFTYTIVLKYGYTWNEALFIILMEGIIFILLSAVKFREVIFKSIPVTLKNSISVGIGFFIAFLGFQSAGLVKAGNGTLISVGDISSPITIVAVLGILITAILVARKVKGAILIGIIATTLIGIPFGITKIPANFSLISIPHGFQEVAFKIAIPKNILEQSFWISLFTLLFLDMFDTVGSLAGVASKTNMLDEDGNLPRVEKALFADAIGTTLGALLGTSTVTTFVESSAGVAEGGRTGLTAIVTGIFFLLSIIFSPLFLLVPAVATAPALIIVGFLMTSPLLKINWEDFTEGIPAFITIAAIPFTESISEGIVFGVLSYTIIKVFSGKYKEISPLVLVLSGLFLLRYLFLNA
ncbi:NCS2 family permease [Helcococcus ovis]|uniref:NCS2 family permease n=1 Tax=Helcococcus ovis TaxID=72026 RepID=A0A4V3IY78_9FIRM|nr:NCS2 family permease [Helcococcus ovis]TFF65490.1 NCS2 family permease [Helcococcus ovis]TFF65728.1 NCS2 family permease [Helcococcus ovis]